MLDFRLTRLFHFVFISLFFFGTCSIALSAEIPLLLPDVDTKKQTHDERNSQEFQNLWQTQQNVDASHWLSSKSERGSWFSNKPRKLNRGLDSFVHSTTSLNIPSIRELPPQTHGLRYPSEEQLRKLYAPIFEEKEELNEPSKIETPVEGSLIWFLKQDEFGFGIDSVLLLGEDIVTLVSEFREYILDFQADIGFLAKLGRSVPSQLLLLLFIFLWWLDRRVKNLRRELWDVLPPLSNLLLDHCLDSVLRGLTGTLPIALLLLPMYFPLKGIYPEAAWLNLTIHLLWVLLTYRALKVSVGELLIGDIFDFSEKPLKLKCWFEVGLKGAVILWGMMGAVDSLGYHEEVHHLLSFSIKVFIAFHSLRLLGLIEEILYLFPAPSDNPLFKTLKSGLAAGLRFMLGLSSVLLIVWSLGYERAATTLLLRSYGMVALLFGAFVLYRRGQSFLTQMIRKQETSDGDPLDREKHQVLSSLESSSFMVGAAAFTWSLLNIVSLWKPIVVLASIPLIHIGDHITISVYSVGRGFFILTLFIFASRILRALLNEKVYPHFEVEVGVGYAINTMAHYFLFFVGLMLGLNSLGIDMTAVGIFFSALGIGIGFGLQSIVNNLISGFILLFGRSVKKGDYVTVNEFYGRVDAVGARSVTITTPDNFELVIPSAELVSNSIINWTLTSPLIRVHIPVGVSYDADVELVRKVLFDAANQHPKVLQRPQPEVWLKGFGDSSVDFNLLIYIDCRQTNQNRVRGELNFYVWDALKKANISIPYPQRDLHILDHTSTPSVHSLIKQSPPSTIKESS